VKVLKLVNVVTPGLVTEVTAEVVKAGIVVVVVVALEVENEDVLVNVNVVEGTVKVEEPIEVVTPGIDVVNTEVVNAGTVVVVKV
jgi:hypothetical protein